MGNDLPEGFTNASFDEGELMRLAGLEAGVQHASTALSCSLGIPREFEPEQRRELEAYVDGLLRAAGHADALGHAVHKLGCHLLDRASEILSELHRQDRREIDALREEMPLT